MLTYCWDETHPLGQHTHEGVFHRLSKPEERQNAIARAYGKPERYPRPVQFFRPANKHHPHGDHRDPANISGPWFCCGGVQLGIVGMGDCDECGEPFPCPTVRGQV